MTHLEMLPRPAAISPKRLQEVLGGCAQPTVRLDRERHELVLAGIAEPPEFPHLIYIPYRLQPAWQHARHGKVRAFRRFGDAGQYEFVPFALETEEASMGAITLLDAEVKTMTK